MRVIKRNGMQSSSVSRTNTSSIGIQYAWRYACIRVFFFAVVFSILPFFRSCVLHSLLIRIESVG